MVRGKMLDWGSRLARQAAQAKADGQPSQDASSRQEEIRKKRDRQGVAAMVKAVQEATILYYNILYYTIQ